MEPKAITVTLAGKTYPLCLTVAALEEFEDLCGGLENLGKFISGVPEGAEEIEAESVNPGHAAVATAQALGVLIAAGEEHRKVLATLNGEVCADRDVPNQFEVQHLMRPADLVVCQNAVMDAIVQGMEQTVEVDSSKNAESAGLD